MDIPMTKDNLKGKQVIIKLTALDKAITTNVSNVDNDGIWFVAGDLVHALAKVATIPVGIAKPIVFVPFSRLDWLVVSSE